MTAFPSIWLWPNRDRSLKRRHPWVFSGAISGVDGDPEPGAIVRVLDHEDRFLAWAYFNRRSQIQARVLDWSESAAIDDGWWRRRISESVERRRALPGLEGTNVCRLVYAEADALPGLIVDRYADFLVVQVLTAGVDRVKSVIADALSDALRPSGIYERSDQDVRQLEGLGAAVGTLAGRTPPDRIEVEERGRRYVVDVKAGQKTGFYIDQRENRRLVAEYARGKDVLDLFSYTGGFSVCALGSGAARTTLVDSSLGALEFAELNLRANGVDPEGVELIQGNVFEVARSYRDEGRRYDVVIADPPKFAQSRSHLEKAERAYKDVNLLGMRLLTPGGILATFSCSGAVETGHFSRIVSWAGVDADRGVQILHRLTQSPDHPIVPSFPESEYLKGLICRIL